MMKIIGIVGSRRRYSPEDYSLMVQTFDSIYNPGDIICSGGCNIGADFFAEWLADERLITIYVINADWKLRGNRAGHERNFIIAYYSDILIALPSSDRTGGTESTIMWMRQLDKPIILI